MNDYMSKKLGYTEGEWYLQKAEHYKIYSDTYKEKVHKNDVPATFIGTKIYVDGEEKEKRYIFSEACVLSHPSNNWENDSELAVFSKVMLGQLIALAVYFEEYSINNGSLLGTKNIIETITKKKWEDVRDIFNNSYSKAHHTTAVMRKSLRDFA